MRFLDEEGLQLLWSNIITEIDNRFSLLDQENIVQEVISAIGTPVFGRVDENNNITLTGELANGTYTLKYESVNGDITNIGTIEIATSASYTDLIPLSINSDGSEYIGANGEDGYKVNYRLNSSGTEVAATGVNVTGYMPIKAGDIVYIKNIVIPKDATGGMNDYTYLTLYTSDFSLVNSTKFNSYGSDHEYLVKDFTTDDNGYVTSFYVQDKYGDIGNGYMRISAVGITDSSIITTNEPIE